MDFTPDYSFVNNQIFMWDSQIGRGPDSSYMQEVLTAAKRHLFIKKSDAEGRGFVRKSSPFGFCNRPE